MDRATLERCAAIADEIAAEWPDAPPERHDDGDKWRRGRQDGAMEVAAAVRELIGDTPQPRPFVRRARADGRPK